MKPVPVGSIVDYHGSRTHGRYVVTSFDLISPDSFTESERLFMAKEGADLAKMYPDGVAYTIWKEGVLRKFGNRMHMISRVRRGSITPTGETEDAPCSWG